MTNASLSQNHRRLDRAVLARLTGELGDDRTVGKLCAAVGQVFSEFLPGFFQNETGIVIDVSYAGFETGLKETLISSLGSALALTDGSLRNWCDDFVIACDSPFIITLVETMLGAASDMVEEPEARALSTIELDVTALVFDKIGAVLRSAVSAEGGFEPLLRAPFNSSERQAIDAATDTFAAVVRMSVGLGPVLSSFYLIVPQRVLLKTAIVSPKAANGIAQAKKEWAEQLAEQVRRSQVTLEARIGLEKLTLGTISRLQPGDVIPFRDLQDVRVEVNANGRELYVCEFGRSGEKYTVRVKDTHGSESDILKHLMG